MTNFLKFLSILRPYRRDITKATLTGALMSCMGLIGPWMTKILVDTVLPNRDYGLLIFVLLVSLSIGVFQSVMGLLRTIYSILIGMRMSLDVRSSFFGHMLSLPLQFFDRRRTGEVLSRFSDADQSLSSVLSLLNMAIMNALSLIVFAPVLFFIDPKLALIGLLILPFDAVVYYHTNRRVRQYARKVAEAKASLSAHNYESFSGIRVLKSLAMETNAREKSDQLLAHMQALSVRLSLLQQGSGLIVGVLRSLGTLLFTYYGWRQIMDGTMSLGTFLAFSNYVLYLYNPIKQFIDMSQDVQQILAHIDRFFEIRDVVPESAENDRTLVLPPVQGRVAFERVTFGYNDSPEILSSVSFEIEAGTLAAIVGRSGIGKTTIANLLLGFYQPREGTVLIDGHDVQRVTLQSLRSQIGYVQQEPFLFHGSIRENVAFGSESTSNGEVMSACKLASIHDFVSALPQRYDTEIGERGVRLSQGQKQRLCLARVLLLNPTILVLDEAMSSLDLCTENSIWCALKESRSKKTTIVIAHRLSTLRDADVIYVLDQGSIRETGTHDELIGNGPVYNLLYRTESLLGQGA